MSIEQLPVTYLNLATSALYVYSFVITFKHRSWNCFDFAQTMYHKLLDQLECYMFDGMQARVILSFSSTINKPYKFLQHFGIHSLYFRVMKLNRV